MRDIVSSGAHAGPIGSVAGAHATDGLGEVFAPDAHCAAGDFPGWDFATGTLCAGGHYSPDSSTMWLNRTFWYGSMGQVPPSPTHEALTFTSFNNPEGAGNFWQAGFNACPAGTYGGDAGTATAPGLSHCPAAKRFYLWGTGNTFGYTWAGARVILWPTASPALGQSDSGQGRGWAPPSGGFFSDNTLLIPGDGTAMFSFIPWGGGVCVTSRFCATAYHVALPTPGALHQVELTGFNTASDFLANIAAVDGVAPASGPPVYDMPDNPVQHTGKFLRWAFHADGRESTYNGDCTSTTDCMNVWAIVPPGYDSSVANPWMVHFHGQENTIASFEGVYEQGSDKILDTLYQHGVVFVSLDFHTTAPSCATCTYGSAQNVADVVMALGKVRSALNLAAAPYATGDSAGGITLMNAVTHGALHPRAILCYSCNLSLGTDYNGAPNQNRQSDLIQQVYGFSSPDQYAAATAGYDPMLLLQAPRTQAETPVEKAGGLLPNAASVLAGIPMYLAADPGDTVVNEALNSQAFYAALNAVHPGLHQLDTTRGGGHVGAPEMLGSVALAWIQAHP